MATKKSDTGKSKISPGIKDNMEGERNEISQRQLVRRTGTIKTPAEAGAAGKPTTPKTW